MSTGTVSPMAVRLHRIAHGLKQEDLAQAINRSQAWLSRVELGLRGSVVNGRDITMMAQALGVNAADLGGTR